MTGTIIVDARNDSFSVGETQDISANLLANDVVSGSTAAALGLQVTSVNVPGLGVVAVGTQFNVTTAGGRTGVATVNANGTFTFDGGNNFTGLTQGQTDNFTLHYTITGVRAPIAGTTICVEAEHMSLHNYTVEHNDYASGDRVVKGVINQWSTAATTFNGQQGNYNLALAVIDENDGRGTIRILVNGVNVSGDIVLNQDNGGWGTGHTTFRTINVHNLALKAGDRVEIQGYGQHGEFARLDNLKFVATGTGGQHFTDTASVTVHINGEGSAFGIVGGRVFLDANGNNLETDSANGFDAGIGGTTVQLLNTAGHVVATTVSDAHGNYSFHVAAGHYKVKVVAPGGLQFVTPNVGTNDGIDSDVGADGVTPGLVEVLAGRTVWEVDAGLRPALRVDAVDDRITVLESEAAGDRETLESGATSVLANDTTEAGAYAGAVVSVNGVSGNVGQFIDLAGGGRVRINADGTVDFDADGDFEALNQGQSAQVQVHYTISRSGPGAVDGKFAYDFWNHVPEHNTIHNIPTGPGDYRGTVGNLDVNALALALTHDPDSYKIRFTGNFQVTTGGTYTFNVGGDDGVGVYVNGHLVAVRDGIHGFETASGQIHLGAGIHSIELRYFEFNGGQGLTLNYAGADTGGAHASIFGVLNSGPIHPTVIHDTASVTITVQGENEPFGIVGGRVFLDANGNNLETNATGGFDGPVAGVTVQLLNLAGQVVATTTSNGNGDYQFHVLAGDYRVKFIAPGGLEFVQNDVGSNDAIDSDAGPGGVTVNPVRVVAGQTLWEVDAGLRVPLAVDAIDDGFSVAETQDISANILANDTPQNGSLSVLSVLANGSAKTIGQSFQVTTEGGRTGTVTVNKDGTFTFDGGNNFVGLNQGQTDRFELHYTAAATTQVEAKYNLLFVLDISNSTIGSGGGVNVFNGTGVGDVNGDGISNTVLDAEIQGVINVINKLRAQGVNPANIDIGLVTFSGIAQGFATVNAATLGTFGLNASNLISTLTAIRSGGWTNYEAGLQEGEHWLATQQGDGAQNRVFFLSDGRPEIGTNNGQPVLQTSANYGDEVARIANNFGAQIHAIDIGANSDLAYLNQIDNTGGAEKVLDVGTLAAALDRATPIVVTDQAKVVVTINGQGQVASIDAVDDRIVVSESEGAGDTEALVGGATSILANDTTDSGPYAGAVVTVNGVAGNVGQFIDLAGGGKIKINANGTVDFSADGDFAALNQGQSAEVRVDYSITKTVPGALDGKLKYDFWNHVPAGHTIHNIPTSAGERVGTVSNLDVNALALALTHDADTYKIRYTGQIQITTGGTYNFTIGGDDGVGIFINGVQVAVRDGIHPFESATGSIHLAAGAHNIEIRYFEASGEQGLAVSYQGPDTAHGQSSIFGAVNSGPIHPTTITDTAAVIVTVNGEGQPNILPVAVNDQIVTDEDTAATPINVLANDNQGDGPATVIAVQGGTVGQPITLTTTEDGQTLTATATLSANGTLTLVPGAAFDLLDANESRTFTLTYTLRDANGDHSTATITLVVNGLNEGPDARDNAYVTAENVAVSGNLITDNTGAGVDSDPNGDALVVSAVTGGSVGAAFAVTTAGGRQGSLVVNADGSFTFTPTGGFDTLFQGQTDTVSFGYTVRDGSGATDPAQVVITLNGLGQPNILPQAVADQIVTDEDTAATPINVLANDNQGDGPASVIAVQGGTVGQPVTLTTTEDGQTLTATATLAANGTLTLVPGAAFDLLDANESRSFTLTYTLRDANGDESTATITLVVNGLNEGPVAQDDVATASERVAALSGNVLSNDSDANGDGLSVVDAGGLAPGSAIAVSAVSSTGRVLTGQVMVMANGTYAFAPGAGFAAMGLGESVVFAVDYTARDTFGAIDSATLRVTIIGANEGPVATANVYRTDEVTAVSGNVLTDDTGAGVDSDPNGDAITVTAVQGGTVGTEFAVTTAGGRQGSLFIGADGSLEFTPKDGFDTLFEGQTDTVTVTYTIIDANGATSTASVTVAIDGIDAKPKAVNDALTITESAANSVNLLANDFGGDGDLALNSVDGTLDQAGSATTDGGRQVGWSIDGNGNVEVRLLNGAGTLFDGQTDTVTLDYTITDQDGDLAAAQVVVTIQGQGTPPDPTRTLAIVGDVDTLAPPEQGFAVAIDISSRAFTGNARIAVGDLNGDGNTGRAIDGALQMVVNLATTLVAEGRGDQEIGLIAAGFDLTRTDEVTAQEIVDAVRAGNAATTVFSVIGTAPNNPVIGTLPSGQQLRGDTIDLTRALAAADAYLIDEGADTGEVIVLTSTDGFSQSLSTLSPPVGDRVFVSDPSAISATLTSKGVDVDVVYIEAGANIAPNALGSALVQIDSDDFVNSVVTAPLIALDTLIDDPQDVVVGQLVEFSLRVNGELIDGIDASDVTVNAAGFDFTAVLDVDLGDALVEVQLGFNTDSDAAVDVVKTITRSVSGDTFQFNVDLDTLLS